MWRRNDVMLVAVGGFMELMSRVANVHAGNVVV